MKPKHLLLILLALCLSLAVLASCDLGNKFTCSLTVAEGAQIDGESSYKVKSGEDAVFRVSLDRYYIFDENSLKLKNAVYDPAQKTITVTGITEDTEVVFTPTKVDYDTFTEVKVMVNPTTATVSASAGDEYHLGDRITLTDTDESGTFAGWTIDGTNVISTDNPYTFTLTDKMVTNANGVCYVKFKATFLNINVCYYDVNGGVIHTDTENYQGNKYLTVKQDGDRLKTTLTPAYLKNCKCGTAFWNDGTFTRDGYILKEYNTKPDGTGESYSPGSKVYQLADGTSPFTLYCIWEAYDASLFTTKSISLNYSAHNDRTYYNGQTRLFQQGLCITGYTGNAQTVAVPDFIDGTPVIAIASGAFNNVSAMSSLVLPRTILKIEDNAFIGCRNLRSLYYPNGVREASDDIFENGDYTFLETFAVYTSTPPVYTNNAGQGVFALKLARVLSTQSYDRLIIIGGSSVYRGLSTQYLEELLGGAFTVVNFGTTRTTHCLMYVEAMAHYAHEGDTIIYAPENSTYLMGDTELYWKTIRDMEGMNNVFRYVDIGKYTGVFDAFSNYCSRIYKTQPKTFECIVATNDINIYGDCISASQQTYVKNYTDAFTITMNEYYRNRGEADWSKSGDENDYTDTRYWSKFNEGDFLTEVNRVLDKVQTCGIPVYFGFCPVDENAMLESAKNPQALKAYDAIFENDYHFTGLIGTSADYIFAHEYFDDNAFHTNNYGRTLRTYQLYLDICDTFDLPVKYTAPSALGTVNRMIGDTYVEMYKDSLCYFETNPDGTIRETVKYPLHFTAK